MENLFTLYRNCPKCDKQLTHQGKSLRNLKANVKRAEKNKIVCMSCSALNLLQRHPDKMQKLRTTYIEKHGNIGTFTGRSLSDTHKDKISKKVKSNWANLTDEERQTCKTKFINKGHHNGMFGKSYLDIWKAKYDEQTIAEKTLNMKIKKSLRFSGCLNPQYGKPPSSGSGNGWKGHYNNMFFRSLRELCFMIDKTRNNIIYKSAENISIPYILHNKNRTYRPDFIINNHLIEIKPQRLIDKCPIVKLKIEAAHKYCEINNLEYIITDVIIDYDVIKEEIDKENLIFQPLYMQKFIEYRETKF